MLNLLSHRARKILSDEIYHSSSAHFLRNDSKIGDLIALLVIAALSSDKADVSRYVSLARTIPEEIAMVIGPAPKAGRARWIDLAKNSPVRLDVRSRRRLFRNRNFWPLTVMHDLRRFSTP